MFANLIKQTTITTGTGALTLIAAPSGFVDVVDQFPVDEYVDYKLEDANGDIEFGIGRLTTAATVGPFDRTSVVETHVSGVVDTSAPTALTLTSGTHTLTCTAIAQSLWAASSGKRGSQPGIGSSHAAGTAAGTQTLLANRQFFQPFLLAGPADVDGRYLVDLCLSL